MEDSLNWVKIALRKHIEEWDIPKQLHCTFPDWEQLIYLYKIVTWDKHTWAVWYEKKFYLSDEYREKPKTIFYDECSTIEECLDSTRKFIENRVSKKTDS